MNNFHFDMTSEGGNTLKLALSKFFGQHGNHVEGYRISAAKGFVLYWAKSEKMTPFPYKLTLEQAADFVNGWLDAADRGVQPDHDGDNGNGFRLYNEAWGHVDNEWQAFAAIQPIWAMYGK